MGTKVLPKCKYCGGDVTEIGTVVDYGVGEYRCNSVCKGYFNAEFYMSTQDVLLETSTRDYQLLVITNIYQKN